LLATAFILDQTTGSEDQREVFGDILLDVVLLHRLVQRWQPPERLLVIVRRIFLDEVGTWRIQWLAVLRDTVGEIPDDGARLGIAKRMAAVALHHDADDAARQVGLPVLGFGGLLFLIG